MQKIILIVAAVVVVVIGGYFLTQNSTPTDNTTTETTNENTNQPITLNGKFEIDPSSSTATWTGSKTIIKDYFDTGSIKIKSGEVTLAENKISSGNIVFDMTSISALKSGKGKDEDKLSGHLKSEDFFDVAKYPIATFISSEVLTDPIQTNNFTLKGKLTIKDVTESIEIPVTLSEKDGVLMGEGQVTVDRTEWDVRYGSNKFFESLGDKVINDNFTLDFELITKKSTQ
jgi:polyisoprenoid-binding protein YceI